MKEPSLRNLKLDPAETRRIRKSVARNKLVKITINLDAESLALLKEEASATGVPYQRLLNRILRDGLTSRESAEVRLTRLEREMASIKKKVAA
ncbi:MAG: BrnA antitoxin family protein [Gammaproteobacteria bacterium]|nr:BrnA antitoxin family protein [Gammaproteobacteria bacterium]